MSAPSLVSDTIPNLIGGISQQPPSIRLASQVQDAENVYPTVVDGLRRRPPTEHVAELMAAPSVPPASHIIDRDSLERYIVTVEGNGRARVFDLEGTPITVTVDSAVPVNSSGHALYLESANPRRDLRFLTLADYTLILNRQKVVSMSPTTSPVRPFEALIYVRGGNYGRTLIVHVNSTSVSKVLPIGDNANQSPELDAKKIASDLVTALNNAGINAGNGWTVQRVDGVIYLSRATDFTIRAEDGQNGTLMTVIKGEVQRFSDLPAKAPNGFVVKVRGNIETVADDYWVRFEERSGLWEGIWVEAPKPGTQIAFDATTMPHALVRQANGTFRLQLVDWAELKVGQIEDLKPSFVDKTISDMTFFQSRLGFLAGENVIMSRASEFFNFWPSSSSQVLDDDPIDVSATVPGVSPLRSAAPFGDGLFVAADQHQFLLRSDGALGPKTVRLTNVGRYEAATIRVVPVDSSVFFASARDAFQTPWTTIRELVAVDVEANSSEVVDATAQCPRLIPGLPVDMQASSNEQALFVLSDSDPERLYVYKWFWADRTKLQSAWVKWSFPGAQVVGFGIVESVLYLLLKRGSALFLERASLGAVVGDNLTAAEVVHLDRRASLSEGTYNLGDDETTFTLPYTPTSPENLRVVAIEGGTEAPGTLATILGVSGAVVRVRGNWASQPIMAGFPYPSSVELTPIHFQMDRGSGRIAKADVTLRLRRLLISLGSAAYLRAEVTLPGRPTKTTAWTIYRTGGPTEIGEWGVTDAVMNVPVFGESTTAKIVLVNDSPFPAAVLGLEWVGSVFSRSRHR